MSDFNIPTEPEAKPIEPRKVIPTKHIITYAIIAVVTLLIIYAIYYKHKYQKAQMYISELNKTNVAYREKIDSLTHIASTYKQQLQQRDEVKSQPQTQHADDIVGETPVVPQI